MTARPAALVEIGRLSKAHGLRGELVLTGARLSADEVLALGEVHARARDGQARALKIAAVRPFLHSLLVRFEGVDDRDRAAELAGRVLEADPARLPRPEAGSVYLFQLLGLAVATEEGRPLGRVADVWATGSTPVLVVREEPGAAEGPGRGPGRERLLPMSPDVLVAVDVEAGAITVRLLPGLEDL